MSNTRALRPTGSAADDQTMGTLDVGPVAVISNEEVDGYKEQDRFLPIANVGRVMKQCLPDSTKVSKDAKEIVQECTSEFISFITSEAAERVSAENRKTINGEDILIALQTLGFENYAQVLTIYLAKYREHQKTVGKRTRKSRNSSAKAIDRTDEWSASPAGANNQESYYEDRGHVQDGHAEQEEGEPNDDDEDEDEEELDSPLGVPAGMEEPGHQLGSLPAYSHHLFSTGEQEAGVSQTSFELDHDEGGITW
ncbi:transcriptional activator hap3 [Microbotryomycetes sp. JL201]|nr:transcriptional activator hap3 [Microbotryomycetes sp. JL201]